MIELLEEPETAISEYNPVAAGLAELRRKYGNVIVDVSTTKALDEAKKVRAEIREPRYETEKIRKALKAPALAHAKLIDTEAARITAELLEIETPWDEAIKAEETRKAAEKAEAERIERERITKIHLRIADIRECGNLALQCRTSAAVLALFDKMKLQVLEGFEEFTDEAENARTDTLARMGEILASKKAEEDERARIKAEQEAEAARLEIVRAELEVNRQKMIEAERIAAQERAAQEAQVQAVRDAEAKKLADERAAFEAEQATARAAAQLLADTLAQERADLAAEIAKRDAEALAAAQPAVAPEPVAALPAEEFIFDQPDGSDDIDGPTEPSDADVISCAATAVADRFGIPFNDALNRLAEVHEWIAVETT